MARDQERLSEEAARAVWRRAAQLQAGAERRMEERARRLASGAALVESGDDGFDAREVEAAAVEAGISADFVRIALAEAGSSRKQAAPLARWEEKGARLVLGTVRHTIELSSTVEEPLDAVTAAVLRVFTAHPCLLQSGEVAGLPMAGGRVAIFKVPDYDWGATANPPFVEKAYMIGLRQLHVTIHPLPGDEPSCEVVVSGDLYPGMRNRWRAGAMSSLLAGAGGGGVGFGVGAAAAALSGAVVALPVLLGAVAGAGLTAVGWGASYRYYQRQVEAAIEEAMGLLPASARSHAMYMRTGAPGDPDALAPALPPGD